MSLDRLVGYLVKIAGAFTIAVIAIALVQVSKRVAPIQITNSRRLSFTLNNEQAAVAQCPLVVLAAPARVAYTMALRLRTA